ncbi:STAS domain-containing protein [Planctomicrobium piriforme]|uniref:Anti-anti-sigma factor n=1 Tax=Planctomicrobium piriforme TaxID=1576369 RepID=A0A1I3SR53_9PLAN|nr:STAS domain-containing protein [Planctomicrobium piriforme]SFJ59927.1 anti-anti-sigma factor [Planctomicrobium piriforme]
MQTTLDRRVALDQIYGVTVISFVGSSVALHGDLVQAISGPLLETAADEHPRILLDLKSVEFFNSSFIELLFRIWNRIRGKESAQFALCNVHPYCREVLDVTNLTTVWKLFPTRDDALNAMQSEQLATVEH